MANQESAAIKQPRKRPVQPPEETRAPARPPLALVQRPRRSPRKRQRKQRGVAESFRDVVTAEILKMVGASENAQPLSGARVTEILPATPAAITYQDFNEVLMFFGLGTVSGAFFAHFFGDGFQTIDSLRDGVARVRTYSFLFYGNFRRGFDELRSANDPAVFARPRWDLNPASTRPMTVDRVTPLTAQEAYATGYLTQSSSLSPQQIGKARKKATANAERYMAMNGVDVYVAGSMRELRDFEEAEALVTTVKESAAVRGLGLTFFNPLWAYVPDSRQKGLLEVLMLKKASVMLFIAGRQDSFGKDSELSTMLVQGKPVIVYVPSVAHSDSQHDDFERQFAMFQKHPLAMQCDLESGVANGVILARNRETCSELLGRLFTNTMEFEIDDSDNHNHYLREKLTGSPVRVITRNELLTESFWQQYLGNDPRRMRSRE